MWSGICQNKLISLLAVRIGYGVKLTALNSCSAVLLNPKAEDKPAASSAHVFLLVQILTIQKETFYAWISGT